jgi:DNA-binding LacI/PurR family transcriptional regulator
LTGTLREFRRRGLRPGDVVSLVSCDELPLTELFEPPISVIRKDNYEIGAQGANLLLRRLQDPECAPEKVLIPSEFVATSSCAPPAS